MSDEDTGSPAESDGDEPERSADGTGATRGMSTLEKPPASEEGEDGPAQATSSAAYTPPAGHRHGHRERRFRSTRRLPAAIVAVVLLAGAVLLLYDVVSVRLGGRAMAWRSGLTDELATRPLDDVWVRVGAVVVALLGVWLLVLAVTPGLRGLLPMRRQAPAVRAGLERQAAELVLRDRAMRVSGVRSVHVEVGRRKIKANARAHFRELDEVRADVDTALEDGIRILGLARHPGLSVQVRRPRKR